MTRHLLEFDRVTRAYTKGSLLSRERFNAVDDVSFSLDADRPEIFAIIGESGSGKTTLARIMLNLVPPSGGAVRFRGTDLTQIHGARQRLSFMRQVQPIFQNPFGAFNPLKKVDRYLFAAARRFTDAESAKRV
ncbi:MAG TPA: ATP-binding cassette domain-containing protein, partial [Gammaproteobacteria bacterium]|nr:ATP-binding cassette domain-containing protein [Gammaproteobacteria bacterium]